MPYDGPGRYRHYKGEEYEVLGLALREETKHAITTPITEVVYRPLTPGSILEQRDEVFWTRILDDFNANVKNPNATTDHPEWKYVPRFKLIRRINAFYFGTAHGQAGHYFFTVEGKHLRYDTTKFLPWKEIDGKLNPNEQQGVCRLHYKDGWTAIAFANRIDDRRPGSNSAFFFDTTLTFGQAVAEARKQFPWIMERIDQSFELRMVEEHPTTWVEA